ncbi:lactate utilization protein [Pseudoflavonifractor sp. An85]|uniref:lactate utilization protein n=1 Tax=Pseudoflavonifractor sp. An85 TaxID=1965661 RepID=UPI000B3909BA|nr:lactate utilization protein [Pseudoflavonifractor sp. An85]OUN20260.1 lactate utilization protein [Pseudoflavonifractor sp. An85]
MKNSNPVAQVREKMIQRTMKMLEHNNMAAHYAPTIQDAQQLVKQLIPQGATVACGGSMSLQEAGIMEILRSGDYTFWDREAVDSTQQDEILRKAFFADYYLSSSNAVTEQGELYNVDGNANRVAALCFGPKHVICVVGYNKIVPTLEDAKERVEAIAAPANTIRLQRDTPCAVTGHCENCHSPQRICCTTVIHQQQREAGRIHVIIVGEELGY